MKVRFYRWVALLFPALLFGLVCLMEFAFPAVPGSAAYGWPWFAAPAALAGVVGLPIGAIFWSELR